MSAVENIRPEPAVLRDLDGLMAEAVQVVDGLFARARANLTTRVSDNGKLSSAAIEREQHAVHGLA